MFGAFLKPCPKFFPSCCIMYRIVTNFKSPKPFVEADLKFLGESERTMEGRCEEHKRHIRLDHTETSAVRTTQHQGRSPHRFQLYLNIRRNIRIHGPPRKGVIEMRLNINSFNRDSGFIWTRVWHPVTNLLNQESWPSTASNWLRYRHSLARDQLRAQGSGRYYIYTHIHIWRRLTSEVFSFPNDENTDLETSVYSPFNYLTRLLSRESFRLILYRHDDRYVNNRHWDYWLLHAADVSVVTQVTSTELLWKVDYWIVMLFSPYIFYYIKFYSDKCTIYYLLFNTCLCQ
jgi:hypothetical protein